MKLIINADDFGYSRGQNLGIIEGFKKGCITSTTLMTTMPATDDAIELALENPNLDIGIHLSLDLGIAVSDPHLIPSLVDENGNLNKYDLSLEELDINLDEVYIEWKAQIEYAIQKGIQPSHFDSHHHIHMYPGLFETFIKLANEYQVGIRFHTRRLSKETEKEYRKLIDDIPKADIFTSGFYDQNANFEFFEQLPQDHATYEMMCHPAYIDQDILDNSSYNTKRAFELHILLSPKLKNILLSKGVQLISFRDL